jgi:alpha-galactosidase
MKTFLLAAILVTVSLTAFSQVKSDHKTWATTPPMGWNSYDAYYGSITEKQFLQEVDVIAKRLLPVGYEYAVIDYCWFNPGPKGWDPDKWITFDVDRPYTNKDRGLFNGMMIDGYGRLLPAVNRFPSAADEKGFKKIGDYVHGKGMKFGIHVMRGIPRDAVWKNTPVLGTKYFAKDIASLTDTCAWNESMYGVDATKPGSQAYYNSLLKLYASWGVDFIKVDDIASPVYHKGEIDLIRHAIDQCGRKIVLSLSPGDAVIGFANEMDNKTNMYRVSNDVWDRWRDILHVFDLLNTWSPFIGNGGWPDADMIPFGKLCLTGYPYAHGPNSKSDKREHESFLNYEEQKTMMTLWCMARSPLIWGGAPSQSSDSAFSVLSNKEILEINKNTINNHQVYQPNQRADHKDYRIWVAESPDKKSKYIAFFNLKDTPLDLVFKTEWELWNGSYVGLELWTKEQTGTITKDFKVNNIPPHGVKVYRLRSPLGI